MIMIMHRRVHVRGRTICRTFCSWTGSAYSEPVHAPEPDQNRHNVKRRCVNRFNFEICPWTILGTHWIVPRVHEPVQKQWTGSNHLLNRFTRNLFWCAIQDFSPFFQCKPGVDLCSRPFAPDHGGNQTTKLCLDAYLNPLYTSCDNVKNIKILYLGRATGLHVVHT